MEFFSDRAKLIGVLVWSAIAAILEFGFNQDQIAYWMIVALAIFVSIEMIIEIIETLKDGRVGIDILALTAVISTLVLGEYWATAMIGVMMVSGGAIEEYTERNNTRELKSLLDHSPTIAHRILANGQIEDVKVEDVQIGDNLLVKAGEVVPVDGVITEGSGYLNEASLTGESEPVERTVGDQLLSGAVNGDNSLRFRVIHVAEDSQYQTIVRLVEEQEENPAEFVKLADKYAVPFTIFAYALGIIAAVVTRNPLRFAQVMVVASPCPLVISAPVAIVSGMSRTSKNGIVVKSGTSLEIMNEIRHIALDKTGTLTLGDLDIDKIETVESISEDELLTLAASAEQGSVHILASSIVDVARNRGLSLLESSNLEESTGNGIQADVLGDSIRVGKADYAHNPGASIDQTAVYVSRNNEYLGRITFHDVVRPESAKTISKLKELGVKHITMLTGDKREIANNIAGGLGITEIKSELLPQDKLNYLSDIQESGERVAMAGDGINDAPALALADVGIAMGARGASAASESADVIIIKDDIYKIAQLVTISQDTMRIAKEAVLIGLGLSSIFMIFAAFGFIPAVIGAILQEGLDIFSMFWAIRARGGRSLD